MTKLTFPNEYLLVSHIFYIFALAIDKGSVA